MLLSGLVLFFDRPKMITSIDRNSYGKGTKKEEYVVRVDGKELDETVLVELREKEYTKKEVREVFTEIMEQLDTIVLGENESFDRVEKDLQLVTKVGAYPIHIQWQTNNYSLLGLDGKINEEKTRENGTLVEIRGVLTYGEEEAMYVRSANIFPPTRVGQDAVLFDVKNAFRKKEEQTRREKEVMLPTQVADKEVQWWTKGESRGYMVLLLGGLLAVLLPFWKKQKKQEVEKARREKLILEYPRLISKITLLLETGMPIKTVWEKVFKQNAEKEVCREMRETYYEMQSGVSEAEAYERFGQRCQVTEYRKFGALLSQNLRKGTKGLCQILNMEALQASENRKNRAKKKAEEAGTKLLVPMFMMLGMVLVIIIVPAFLSMQI